MKKLSNFFPILVIFLAFFLGGCDLIRQPAPTASPMAQVTEEETGEVTEEAQEGYIDVSPQEAKQLIEENPELIVIDVSPHYDQGHLPGAINYYLGDGSLDAAIPDLDKEATYLVYCHVDSVSIAGAEKLVEAGIKKVYRLKGNYSAWVEAGYEVEK